MLPWCRCFSQLISTNIVFLDWVRSLGYCDDLEWSQYFHHVRLSYLDTDLSLEGSLWLASVSSKIMLIMHSWPHHSWAGRFCLIKQPLEHMAYLFDYHATHRTINISFNSVTPHPVIEFVYLPQMLCYPEMPSSLRCPFLVLKEVYF